MRKAGFLNYPEPLKGPDVPYKNDRKQNPPLRGFILVIAVFLMEWVRFVREHIWWNAGFGSLRKIRYLIQDYEPWFEPQVIKLPAPRESETGEDDDAATEEIPDARAKYPAAKYYSVADYHALYLSGELTPTQVARALLPLIRRDTSPPGKHSTAWFDTKVDLVLKAAEESTLRYKEKRSLGLLDGVPTAVKDEFDMDGYMTCLGSVNDYTGQLQDGDNNSITTWCVRRLQGAGAVILGKLSMHEFGLDTTGNNPIYGTPPNPFNKNYYTGGSSSGSAYAVSAGLIPIALGSDGGGSIRIPSAYCGIFGLKPTHGRLSHRPGQNHCLTCSVNGPMAADIRSLAALYECIGEPHPSSHFPPIAPLRLSPSAPRTRILGIPETWFSRATPAIQHLCRTFISRLVTEYGYSTVPIEIPFLVEGQTAHALTVLADAATLLPDTRNLTPANKVMLALGRVTPATDLILAQKLRACLMQHLSYIWEQHPGLLIVTPTTSCAGWPVRSQAELKWGVNDGDLTIQSMEYVWIGNLCGLPGLSVPAGFIAPEGHPKAGQVASLDVEGKIPVGLMAMGEWCSEEQLLQFGLDAERVGAERMARPPIWVDVVKQAKEEEDM